MFRISSNGLAAVGLAAVIALVALMNGAVTKSVEAAPGPITLAPTSSASCTTGFVASIPAADATQTSVTFSVTPSVAGTFSATTVPLSAGTASTTFTLAPGYGQATIVASSGGVSSNSSVVTANCGAQNPCYNYNCGTCDPYLYNNYNCGTCYNNAYNCGNCNNNAYNCGTCYNAGCSNCGINYYTGCNTNCGNAYYAGCTASGCGVPYNSVYGCVNQCGVYYTSCTFPSCGNIYGPILNCSSAYTPPGNIQYIPGRVSILPSASTVSCGGATAITVTVTDPNGFKVPDGTNVTFTTTLGYIQASDQTIGGTAVASLTIPPGTSGNAKVSAAAGGQSADTTISVTCAAGAPAVVVQPLAPAPFPFPVGPRPTILPPSTGDAGLAAE